jgi:hypothetical protein
MFLAGRRHWAGWAVGLGNQVLWSVYSLVTRQWGFLISCAVFGTVYVINLRAWRSAARSNATRVTST